MSNVSYVELVATIDDVLFQDELVRQLDFNVPPKLNGELGHRNVETKVSVAIVKKKAFNGQLRCKTHKAKNKQNCRDWWIRRVKTTPEGFCKCCSERRPVLPNRKTCQFCYIIQKLRGSGYKVSKMWSMEQLNAFMAKTLLSLGFSLDISTSSGIIYT